MSVQVCEGVWRSRCGQRLLITQCEPVDGQQWTDGCEFYSDDGRYYQSEREDSQDLVTFVGLLPDKSQVDQTAEIKRLQAEWRTEFTAAQQLRSEVAQLEQLLDEAREKLRYQEAAARAFDHHCEGMKAAFLATIKTLTGVQS